MESITVKFGGTSLASAEQFRKVAHIVQSDPRRRYVVASAPGKRSTEDIKVTDLLYRCYDCADDAEKLEEALGKVAARYQSIASSLGVEFELTGEIAALRAYLRHEPQRDHVASRGEYLGAKLLAAFLGIAFIDAAEVVRFRADGSFDAEKTNELLAAALRRHDRAVIPGFYGARPDGTIQTFSRGGSDITGALVARASASVLYENWTDVSGMLAVDPRVVPNPRVVSYITYEELRELSYMGASVLHEDAVFPARMAQIPINIRNTDRPLDPGTMITAALPQGARSERVVGIAGRKGFTSIHVERSMMNMEVGYGAALLTIFSNHGVPFEHCPTSIDSISVVVNTEQFCANADEILAEIRERLQPDTLVVEDSLALIAVVGHGVAEASLVASEVFGALAKEGIGVRMIDQGAGRLNIILGVAEKDYETALRAIYDTCVK